MADDVTATPLSQEELTAAIEDLVRQCLLSISRGEAPPDLVIPRRDVSNSRTDGVIRLGSGVVHRSMMRCPATYAKSKFHFR
jgi:hypothetical protein